MNQHKTKSEFQGGQEARRNVCGWISGVRRGLLLLASCAVLSGVEKVWAFEDAGFVIINTSTATVYASWSLLLDYDQIPYSTYYGTTPGGHQHRISSQGLTPVSTDKPFVADASKCANGHIMGVIRWFSDAAGQKLLQSDTVDMYFCPPESGVAMAEWGDVGVVGYFYYFDVSTYSGGARRSNLSTNNPNPALSHKGDPVNDISGAVVTDATDISIPAPGIPLTFSRSYNSVSSCNGPLGPRWTHSFNWMLSPSNTTVSGFTNLCRIVQNASGDQWVYNLNTNNTFDPTFDNASCLLYTNSAFYLTFPGGINYIFATNGTLQTIRDSWNNQISFSYTNRSGTNLLLSATHSDGQSLAFSYQNNLLTNIAIPSPNLSIAFFYNTLGELTNATTRTPTGVSLTSYLYDYATNYCNHSLTQKINAVGDVYTWQYATNANGTINSKGTRACIGSNYLDTYFTYVTNAPYTVVASPHGTNTLYTDCWFDPVQLRITAESGPSLAPTNCETIGTGTRYAYDNNGNATNIQIYDFNQTLSGNTWNQYDSRHNITNSVFAYCAPAGSNYYSYSWDTNWNVMTSSVDPDGHKVTMQYTNGAIAKASVFYTASNSFDTLYSYTTNGLVAAITNANGHGVAYLHDSQGNISATIPQLGPSNSMAWDSLGHLTNINLCGGTWVTSGDINNLTQTFVPRKISYSPDSLGRNSKTTWQDGSTETFGWDAIGNLTNYVDRGGRVTKMSWLPTRKLASKTRYLLEAGNQAATIGYAYDQQLNTLKITDELNRSVESYQLDLQDRPVTVSNIESQQMTMVWGLGKMVKNITRFDGTTNSFQYNSDGLIRQSIFPDDTLSFTYFKNGTPKTIANQWGSISNTLDGAGRLVSTTSSVPKSAVNYGYFPGGQVSNVTSVAGTSSYALDAADRIQNQTILRPNAAADSLVYSYNPNNGLIASVAYSNRMGYANSFDVCDRLTALTWNGPASNVLASRTYQYNITGTISQETKETGEQSGFVYDSLDRLTTETHFDPAGELISAAVYGYDLAGNRTNKTVYGPGSSQLASVNYTYGPGNRLTSWNVAQTNFEGQVDIAGYSSKPIGTNNNFGVLQVSCGNVTLTPSVAGSNFAAYGVAIGMGTQQVVAAIRDQAGNVGVTTNTIFMTVVTNGNYLYSTAGCLTNIQFTGKQYQRTVGLTWNGQYQLVASFTNGVAAERYGFDALGRRAWIWNGVATNYMVYDGPHVIAEVDATGGLKRAYAYAPGIDQAISMAVYSGGATSVPTTYYYLRDRLGSVLALTETNGVIVERYRYDAWGRTTVYDTNENPLTQSAVGNRIAFQGREIAWVTGLYYFRARWYDPFTGRFISNDPSGISGGLNMYQAFGGDPVCNLDPTGLWTFQIGLSMNGQLGPVNVNFSVGIAGDGHGHVGWFKATGGGYGAGARFSGGVSFGGSSGDCIDDLAGPFGNMSASLGAGINGSVDVFSGPGSHGQPVVGGGVTAGFGAGGGFSMGGSQTTVHTLF